MEITIHLVEGRRIPLSVQPSDTVAAVKRRVTAAVHGQAASRRAHALDMKLTFLARELDNAMQLWDSGVRSGSVLHEVLWLRGD
jgi:hypothetical protein